LKSQSFQIFKYVWSLLAMATVTASAQTAGQLAGVVRDTSGAVLPGVVLTVTGASSVDVRTAIADDHGRYKMDNLPAGRFLVVAALSGFETRATEVDIDASLVTLDLVLAVSSFSERVTVTATRTGTTDVQATPAAITALNAKTIEQSGIHTVDGLAGVTPAVTIIPSGGGNALVSIRGVGSNAFVAGADPSSTIYLDGVYLGRPAMAALDFLNVERVEVLRGPQGTLYGRNSVGGAIHVVTRPPTNALEASARLVAGDFGKLRAEGAVGGPLIKNKVMGNVAFLRGTGAGFVRDLDHPDHSLGSDDTWAGRGQLRLVFGTRSELLLSGDYGRFEGTPLAYAKAILAKPGFRFDNPASLWAVRASHLASGKNIQQGASAKLSVQLNATTILTSLSAYRNSNYRYFVDADATELPVVVADVPDLQRQVSQEVTVVQHTAKLAWIGGAFVFNDHNEGPVEVTTFPAGIQTRLFPRIGTDARALFGQASYSVSSRVSLTGGIRYTHEHKDLDNTGGVYRLGTAMLADPTSFYDYVDNVTSKAWTPKGSIEIQVSHGTFVYASATRGFKSGGFNTTARKPGQTFSPEFAWSYEGGLKRTMANGRVRANTAVFHTDYRDLQVLSFSAPGVFEIGNAGSATINGIELEATAAAGRGVQLSGNVSWLDATYDRYLARVSSAATLDAAGKRLTNAPEWSGSASAVYEFATGLAGTASVRGDLSWQGRVFFTPENTAIEAQRAYGLVHMRGGFEPRNRRWEIAVYVRNARNSEYVGGVAGVIPTAFTARPGEPRRWGTQFTIRR
jgi:iron complex outermembrane recepter protein